MKRLKLFWAAALGVLAVPGATGAEATWAIPERFAATPGATLWVEITQGAVFGEPGGPVVPNKIDKITGRLGGDPLAVTPPADSERAIRFATTLPRPGVAVLVADLKREARDIPRVEVEQYLRDVHATDDVRAAWEDLTGTASWREIRAVRLKTYIRVGQPPADNRSWAQTTDDGLDIVPQSDPTSLHANDDFEVRVTRSGRPISGLIVAFLSQGETREHVLVTDSDGRGKASLDAPGAWLIRAVDLQRVSTPDHDWASEVVALTLETR